MSPKSLRRPAPGDPGLRRPPGASPRPRPLPPVDAEGLQVAQRPLVQPQHLLLVRQVGPRRRERHDGRSPSAAAAPPGNGSPAARGAGRRPEGRGDRSHFRFRPGEPGAAAMSRYKFVGKTLVFLAAGVGPGGSSGFSEGSPGARGPWAPGLPASPCGAGFRAACGSARGAVRTCAPNACGVNKERKNTKTQLLKHRAGGHCGLLFPACAGPHCPLLGKE